ncbi:glycosyltransferase [Dethiosulfatarculus sandiegensis]|uniref:Glycosyl transferase family 1 domain-containing protein n=1 Tax=Dethiosulfatarculus sandiegensis TaxID=1429043 RepID=A0A0D2HLW2_9BACT|nr:glycosyltransferase [Dethiosulfatarculus sandiegensis]KIX11558.1 hypothetical protein X474_24320 [Dethiosulfatarculus sandiegensis]
MSSLSAGKLKQIIRKKLLIRVKNQFRPLIEKSSKKNIIINDSDIKKWVQTNDEVSIKKRLITIQQKMLNNHVTPYEIAYGFKLAYHTKNYLYIANFIDLVGYSELDLKTKYLVVIALTSLNHFSDAYLLLDSFDSKYRLNRYYLNSFLVIEKERAKRAQERNKNIYDSFLVVTTLTSLYKFVLKINPKDKEIINSLYKSLIYIRQINYRMNITIDTNQVNLRKFINLAIQKDYLRENVDVYSSDELFILNKLFIKNCIGKVSKKVILKNLKIIENKFLRNTLDANEKNTAIFLAYRTKKYDFVCRFYEHTSSDELDAASPFLVLKSFLILGENDAAYNCLDNFESNLKKSNKFIISWLSLEKNRAMKAIKSDYISPDSLRAIKGFYSIYTGLDQKNINIEKVNLIVEKFLNFVRNLDYNSDVKFDWESDELTVILDSLLHYIEPNEDWNNFLIYHPFLVKRLIERNNEDKVYQFWNSYLKSEKFIPGTPNSNLIKGLLILLKSIQTIGIDYNLKINYPIIKNDAFLNFIKRKNEILSIWENSPVYKKLILEELERRNERDSFLKKSTESRDKKNILFISRINWIFIEPLIRQLEQTERFNIRTFDMICLHGVNQNYLNAQSIIPTESSKKRSLEYNFIADNNPIFKNLVEWSDIVIIEWGASHAVWCSKFLPIDKKVIVKIHSYEAFSYWPYFMNWGGVDGILFVAHHIKDIFKLQHEKRIDRISVEVIGNVKEFQNINASNSDESRIFTLGMIGYSNRNKNPLLACKVLKKLLIDNPKWKLHLIGHYWDHETTLEKTELQYKKEFDAFIENNNLRANLKFIKYTENIYEECSNIGFILSCSDREGTHEAVMEAMSVGSIPIIRNWPFAAQFNGVHKLYKNLDDFIYNEPQEAKEIITKSILNFDSISNQIIKYAKSNFDASAVIPKYVKFIDKIVGEIKEVCN